MGIHLRQIPLKGILTRLCGGNTLVKLVKLGLVLLKLPLHPTKILGQGLVGRLQRPHTPSKPVPFHRVAGMGALLLGLLLGNLGIHGTLAIKVCFGLVREVNLLLNLALQLLHALLELLGLPLTSKISPIAGGTDGHMDLDPRPH